MPGFRDRLDEVKSVWGRVSPGWRWRLAFWLAAVGVLIWLAIAQKPWDVPMPVDGRPRLRELVPYWSWWAGFGNMVLLIVLGSLGAWWAGRVEPGELPAERSGSLGYKLGVCIAVVLLLAFAIPRLGDSLWVDEDFSVRDAVWGRHRVDAESGEARMRRHSWQRTIYFYETPNNHVLYSILGRLGLEAWQAVARPQGLPFTEWPFRLPSVLAGVCGVLAVGWFFSLLGWRGAGLLAVGLLAVNPWYVRYASEARGFSMVMCLVVLLACLLVLVVRDGRWRWWAAYGACQFALFYVFPAAIYVLVVANLCCLAALWLDRKAAVPRSNQTGRWLLACSLAGMAVLQLMLPLKPQMVSYLGLDIAQGGMGWFWIRSFLSQVFVGVPWLGSVEPNYPHMWTLMDGQPVLSWLLIVGGVVALAAGTLRFFSRGVLGSALWILLILPGPACFLIASALGQYLFDRYTMYLLPGVVIVVAAGFDLVRGLPGRWWLVLPCAAWAAYFAFALPVLLWQIERSTNPIRQSVLLTRPTLDPRDPRQAGIRTVSFSFTPVTYDAHVHYPSNREEFLAELRTADAAGQVLYVNIGNPWSAETFQKEMHEILMNPVLFEPPTRLLGWNATMDRMVARYRPGSIALLDSAGGE